MMSHPAFKVTVESVDYSPMQQAGGVELFPYSVFHLAVRCTWPRPGWSAIEETHRITSDRLRQPFCGLYLHLTQVEGEDHGFFVVSASATPPPPAMLVPFDFAAARAALGAVDLSSCATPGGPSGPGHVFMTYEGDGQASAAVVQKGTYDGTPAKACLEQRFKAARVPPFDTHRQELDHPFDLRSGRLL